MVNLFFNLFAKKRGNGSVDLLTSIPAIRVDNKEALFSKAVKTVMEDDLAFQVEREFLKYVYGEDAYTQTCAAREEYGLDSSRIVEIRQRYPKAISCTFGYGLPSDYRGIARKMAKDWIKMNYAEI